MDSRSGFGVSLVIIGLIGVWLLVTGRLKMVADAFKGAVTPTAVGSPVTGTTNASDPGAAFNAAPGVFAPRRASFDMPLGSSQVAYGVRVGGDGVKLEPLGSASFGA